MGRNQSIYLSTKYWYRRLISLETHTSHTETYCWRCCCSSCRWGVHCPHGFADERHEEVAVDERRCESELVYEERRVRRQRVARHKEAP